MHSCRLLCIIMSIYTYTLYFIFSYSYILLLLHVKMCLHIAVFASEIKCSSYGLGEHWCVTNSIVIIVIYCIVCFLDCKYDHILVYVHVHHMFNNQSCTIQCTTTGTYVYVHLCVHPALIMFSYSYFWFMLCIHVIPIYTYMHVCAGTVLAYQHIIYNTDLFVILAYLHGATLLCAYLQCTCVYIYITTVHAHSYFCVRMYMHICWLCDECIFIMCLLCILVISLVYYNAYLQVLVYCTCFNILYFWLIYALYMHVVSIHTYLHAILCIYLHM